MIKNFIILIIFILSFSVIAQSQDNFKDEFSVYEKSLQKYFDSSRRDTLISDQYKNLETYFFLSNDIIENTSKRIKIGDKYIKLEPVSSKEIKKQNISQVFKIIPIRIKEESFYITIIRYSVAKSNRKELKLVNLGGGDYIFRYNCDYDIYELKEEDYE